MPRASQLEGRCSTRAACCRTRTERAGFGLLELDHGLAAVVSQSSTSRSSGSPRRTVTCRSSPFAPPEDALLRPVPGRARTSVANHSSARSRLGQRLRDLGRLRRKRPLSDVRLPRLRIIEDSRPSVPMVVESERAVRALRSTSSAPAPAGDGSSSSGRRWTSSVGEPSSVRQLLFLGPRMPTRTSTCMSIRRARRVCRLRHLRRHAVRTARRVYLRRRDGDVGQGPPFSPPGRLEAARVRTRR